MSSTRPKQRRELTDSERAQVVLSLLQRSVEGVPRRGAIKEVAAKFRVTSQTVARVWKRAKVEEAKTGCLRADSRRHERGWPMADLSAKLEKLHITPFAQRSTLRSASVACGVTRATLHCHVQGGQLVAHVSNVKQLLTDANRQPEWHGAFRRCILLLCSSMTCLTLFMLMKSCFI